MIIIPSKTKQFYPEIDEINTFYLLPPEQMKSTHSIYYCKDRGYMHFNSVGIRTAKPPQSFGGSEFNRVKEQFEYYI